MTEAYTPHQPMMLVTDEAQELGLHLPTIEIAERLTIRLARHNYTLDVDDIALFNGVKESDVEDPVTIKVDALPKDAKRQIPAITFDSDTYNGTAKAHIKISPAPEMSPEESRRINAAFWLGVLVSEQLAEGEHIYTEQPSATSNIFGKYVGRFATIGLVANTDHWYELINHMHQAAFVSPTNLASIATGTVAGVAYSHLYRKYRTAPTSVNKIQKAKRKDADELGKEFQVLNYGVRL